MAGYKVLYFVEIVLIIGLLIVNINNITDIRKINEEIEKIDQQIEAIQIEQSASELTDLTEVNEPITPVNYGNDSRRYVTNEEYELLLRVCMSECGGKWGEPIEGKIAVVETILNRVDMGYGSITEVITAPNQYSLADNGEPDESVVNAVEMALRNNVFPDNMIFFRANHYHPFGTPYRQIGLHYFSLYEV